MKKDDEETVFTGGCRAADEAYEEKIPLKMQVNHLTLSIRNNIKIIYDRRWCEGF